MKRRVARLYRRLERALNPGLVPPREHARNGDLARDAGDWELAKVHYLKALSGDPSLEAIWVQLGHAHKIAADLQASENAYRRALQLNGRNGDSWLQLGHVLRLQGRLAEARTCYEQAAILSPDNSDALREAESLGADPSILSQAPVSGDRMTSSASYSSRLIGRGRLVVDITAAADLDEAIVSAICDALSRHRDYPADFVAWREGEWRTLTGEPYEPTAASVALVAIGPWTVYRPDHDQALKYYALSCGAPVIGGLMDLAPFHEPQMFAPSAVEAAARYLHVLGGMASGVLALLGVDIEEARDLVRRFTPNVGEVTAAFSGSEKPMEDAAGLIALVGIESSAEFQVAARALEILPASEAAQYRLANATDNAAVCDGIGAVLLNSDVQTRLFGQLMIDHGRPIALGARRGLSAFAPQASLRMPALDARLTASHLKAFAALCANSGQAQVVTAPRGSKGLEAIAGWRIRELVLSDDVELTFIVDAVATEAPLLSGRISLSPASLRRVESEGLRLGSDPADLDVLAGPQETTAMLLVTSKRAFATVTVATAMECEPVQIQIAAAAAKWIQVRLPEKNTAHTLSISTDASSPAGAHLLAVCLYPAKNRNAWLRFNDQVERGTHSRLKAEIRKIAECDVSAKSGRTATMDNYIPPS